MTSQDEHHIAARYRHTGGEEHQVEDEPRCGLWLASMVFLGGVFWLGVGLWLWRVAG